MMVENSLTTVIETVRRYVDRNQPTDYRLVVTEDPSLIRQEEDWWYIVVEPQPGNVRSDRYAERLSDIEEEIWDKEQLHVLLVPTLAS